MGEGRAVRPRPSLKGTVFLCAVRMSWPVFGSRTEPGQCPQPCSHKSPETPKTQPCLSPLPLLAPLSCPSSRNLFKGSCRPKCMVATSGFSLERQLILKQHMYPHFYFPPKDLSISRLSTRKIKSQDAGNENIINSKITG